MYALSNEVKVKFIMYELDKYLDEVKVKDYAQTRRRVFFSFINPSQSTHQSYICVDDISVIETEQEQNKNDFSLSEIKLNVSHTPFIIEARWWWSIQS